MDAIADAPALPTNVFPESRTVLGEGPRDTGWMFVGEAPGELEDATGRPFVGPSGKLLNLALEYYTPIRRGQAYVTNIVKHRPPGNATPKVAQIKPYLPYFWDELLQVNPRVLVTLGAISARVIDKSIKLKDDHGVARRVTLECGWSGVVIPWFHPAYALRNAITFEDFADDASRLMHQTELVDMPRRDPVYELADEATVVSALLAKWGAFGFDTETTSPRRGAGKKYFMTDEAEMVGYSVTITPGTGWYVPTTSVGPGMAAILESPLWTKVCHNAKFEYKVLQKQGVTIRGIHDTKVAGFLLGERNTGLKALTKQVLGLTPISYDEVTKGKQMSEVPPEEIKDYAAMDSDHTLQLWPYFERRLEAENLRELYDKFEIGLIPVLAAMEKRGMGVDLAAVMQVRRDLQRAINSASDAFLHAASEALERELPADFNINSGDQLAEIFEELGAPLRKRTETTKRLVVDAPQLETIREWRPALIGPLLDYRKFCKMMVFATNFLALRGPDGRLHASFNQAGQWEEAGDAALSAPATGRISCSAPNMQQIPNHRARAGDVDWGQELRKCIIATPGFTLMSADLGQEEPRVVAVMAQDETLLRGFAEGRDIYRPATEALYPYTKDDSLDDHAFKDKREFERFVGKTFFLAWYYGAGAGRLKQMDPNLTGADVTRGLGLLSEAHPARNAFLEGVKAELVEHGCVTTLYGRKRWIRKVWSRDREEREDALREAANMKVQGTAADILKRALQRLHESLPEDKGFLVSTVHDEVILEVLYGWENVVAERVTDAFRGLLPGIDLVLEMYVGDCWATRTRI